MKRIASPDIADAVATTFAAEVATLPLNADWVGTGQVISEYNPFTPEHMTGEIARPRYFAPGWARLREEGRPIRRASLDAVGANSRLLDSFPHYLNSPTSRPSRVGPLHFVSGESDKPFLLSSIPVGERTSHNPEVHRTICLVDRIRAEPRDASLRRSFVFLCGSLPAIVGGEFSTVIAHHLQRCVTVPIKHEDAFRVRADRAELPAIGARSLLRDERPGSDDLLF
jgi:hypothetical protein